MSTPDDTPPPPTDGERLTALEGEVTAMGNALAELLRRTDATTVRSWLTVDDPATARGMLDELVPWVAAVWGRYPGTALPDCWALHPWVVEELWVCMQAWLLAERKPGDYRARDAWHERGRPGVARRIREGCQSCEPGVHLTPTAPGADVDLPALAAIAEQWAATRTVPAPTLRAAA